MFLLPLKGSPNKVNSQAFNKWGSFFSVEMGPISRKLTQWVLSSLLTTETKGPLLLVVEPFDLIPPGSIHMWQDHPSPWQPESPFAPTNSAVQASPKLSWLSLFTGAFILPTKSRPWKIDLSRPTQGCVSRGLLNFLCLSMKAVDEYLGSHSYPQPRRLILFCSLVHRAGAVKLSTGWRTVHNSSVLP